jgi:O-antigen/teichoic acid export membrane protein
LSQPALQVAAAAAAPAGGSSAAAGVASPGTAAATPAVPSTVIGAHAARDNLARRTARGFVWLMAQTVGSKLVGMAGQVILAWLLFPEDLGLWGAAASVVAFAALIQQAGLRETLIHRQRTYHLWANSAFWMSVGLGLLGGIVTAALAWPAAHFLNDGRLVGLLLACAVTMPLMSLDQVAEAKLQNQLRFGLLASVNWLVAVAQLALTVLFAILLDKPYKAYAFVLPRPFIAAGRFAVLWNAARPPVRWNIQSNRWRYLMGDSATLFTSNFFLMLQWQGDYLVIQKLFSAAVLGIYYQAYNLSIQTMQLFTGNLTGVLFPALSKLQSDPQRQIRAFLDATRLLAIVAVPLCFMQMAGADPGVRLFFQDNKWAAAIPVLQALSVGMAFRVVASPGGSLIQAQGRFRVILITNIVNAILFLSLAIAGALLGDRNSPNVWRQPATTVGVAVACYFALIGPIFLYIAIRPSGGRWRDIWGVYWAPMLCSAVAVSIGMWMGTFVPEIRGHRWRQFARLAVILTWSTVLYVPLIRFVAPQTWHNLVGRVVRLYRGRLGEGAD